MNNRQIGSFDGMADELWLEVFSYLDEPKSLAACACVNKQFNSVSSDFKR